VAVFGATSDVTATVALALPSGVSSLGPSTVTVRVRVEPVTQTRTFTAGLRLDGMQDGLEYRPSQDHVLLTLFGSVADLDRLASVPLTVGLSVAGLDPGSHDLTVVPSVPSGVTVALVTPEHVTVVISVPQASPSPPEGGSTTPSPSPTPGP
jgi:YbbR domain-containing protein